MQLGIAAGDIIALDRQAETGDNLVIGLQNEGDDGTNDGTNCSDLVCSSFETLAFQSHFICYAHVTLFISESLDCYSTLNYTQYD